MIAKGVMTSEFWLTIVTITAIVVLALMDRATPDIIGALTGADGFYLWSRTRVKQANGGD